MAVRNHSHTYTFGFDSEPTLNQLVVELQAAETVMGGDSTVNINAGNSQRDGYYFTATVVGRTAL